MENFGLIIFAHMSSGLVMTCQGIKSIFKVVQLLVFGLVEIHNQCVLGTLFLMFGGVLNQR